MNQDRNESRNPQAAGQSGSEGSQRRDTNSDYGGAHSRGRGQGQGQGGGDASGAGDENASGGASQ